MHILAWKAMAMAATLLQLCSSKELESNLSLQDKIAKLPGQPQVSFQQFSGYITMDNKKQRALFYYFDEAELDPSTKPLVLWLNGGPGCSSVGVGAFSENGPFRPSGQVLVRNEYSWNKEASMLYLETPAGVGFSYATDSSCYEGVDDKMTAWLVEWRGGHCLSYARYHHEDGDQAFIRVPIEKVSPRLRKRPGDGRSLDSASASQAADGGPS